MGKSLQNNWLHWKQARRLFSVSFFVLTCLSVWFVLPDHFSKQMIALQLGPAIIHLSTGWSAWTLTGILVLLVLLFGFGRIYCSTICPLGFVQDVAIWLGKLFRIKTNWEISQKKRLKIIRISLFVVSVLLLFMGSAFAAGLIEPFTIFSRFLFLLKMPFLAIFNQIIWVSILIVISILAVLLTAMKYGRFFCSWICPVGTLLWVFSKFQLFKFRINGTSCNQCNQCLKSCKAGAISVKEKEIDPLLCVGCFNCLPVCNQQAIQLLPTKVTAKVIATELVQKSTNEFITAERRKFLKQFGTAMLLMNTPFIAKATLEFGKVHSENLQYLPVFPLGATNWQRFKSTCTGCMMCAEKCPSQIITPTFHSLGSSPILPTLNFLNNYCLEDCVACSEVCPTGALEEVLYANKKTTRMATLELELIECRIVKEGLECSICAEICPLNAIKMINVPDRELKIPTVIQEVCNGCGKCQYRCPVKEKEKIFRFSSTKILLQ